MTEALTPTRDTETPLNAFSRCHLGIVSQLEKTARLPMLVDAAVQARNIARSTLEMFRKTAMPHHVEEEVELFPAVLAACDDAEKPMVRNMVETLTLQHRDMETRWRALEPSVRAAAKGTATEIDAEQMEELVRVYLRHARYEETVFLPLAERILGRKDKHLAALGVALHLRHAPHVVGYL